LAITLKRQLDLSEKEQILAIHGRNCYATGHPIPDDAPLHFDHIRAFATGGPSSLDNIAPMCEPHNKAKGTLPLEDFRVRLKMRDFFQESRDVTLHDLLKYFKEKETGFTFGNPSTANVLGDGVTLSGSGSDAQYELYTCPTTGWRYFYATLPISLLDSDDADDSGAGLQPRFLIEDKVFELFRHFQTHPVLQPSIGRVRGSQIVIFDGQHKIASLLWNGRKNFECKVYLNPDLRLLNDTNISAHDKYSQTRFFASIMVRKLGDEFGGDFEVYRNQEDGKPKSEDGFIQFLRATQVLTRGEVNERFRSYLFNSVLKSSDNSLAKYISTGNRSSAATPLTLDVLKKSLFAKFIYQAPLTESLTGVEYKRDSELSNVLALGNYMVDLALHNWSSDASTKTDTQRKLERIFGSKSMMAWFELLHGAVCGKLEIDDADDRAKVFLRDLSDKQLERIKVIVGRLFDWPLWSAPAGHEIDRILSDRKTAVKDWMKIKGLTTGYLMGASE
jgi:hypothetical protein